MCSQLRGNLRHGGASLFELRDRAGHGAFAHVHLLAIRLRHRNRGFLRLQRVFQSLYIGLRHSNGGFGVVAILRRHFALVIELLHAFQIGLIAPELRFGLVELRVG